MYCFAGKLLFADLSSGTIETRPLPEDYARQYLGGPGLGARILYDEMPAHVGVFDPESVVGWVCGALNDSSGFMTCRYTVVSKSPVYNGWNDANSGGSLDLLSAGLDLTAYSSGEFLPNRSISISIMGRRNSAMLPATGERLPHQNLRTLSRKNSAKKSSYPVSEEPENKRNIPLLS